MINDEKEVVDTDKDVFVDKDPGLFYEEMREETIKKEEKVEEVKKEKAEEVIDADKDGFVDKDPGLFYEEMKEEKVKEGSDSSTGNLTEKKVDIIEDSAVASEEIGRNIELASNIVKEENRNLPIDVKPILEVIKEKMKSIGKVCYNVLEIVGDMVMGIFKKKD